MDSKYSVIGPEPSKPGSRLIWQVEWGLSFNPSRALMPGSRMEDTAGHLDTLAGKTCLEPQCAWPHVLEHVASNCHGQSNAKLSYLSWVGPDARRP